MDLDDRQLLDGARRGEATAATLLVDRFYERLFAFLRRLAGNEADAADLTQRAFARIWPALASFAGRSSVSSWMHGIAYRTYVDWLRSDHPAEHRPDEWWEGCAAPVHSPAEEAVANDLTAALYRAVDELEPDVRSTVHLHYYQALTLQETADALGVAASTVKYRLRQALPQLQARLSENGRPFPHASLHPVL